MTAAGAPHTRPRTVGRSGDLRLAFVSSFAAARNSSCNPGLVVFWWDGCPAPVSFRRGCRRQAGRRDYPIGTGCTGPLGLPRKVVSERTHWPSVGSLEQPSASKSTVLTS